MTCVQDRCTLGLEPESLDIVVANRVGDPGNKPFYIEDMLKGSCRYLATGGLVIGGYWPLQLAKDSPAVIDLLEYLQNSKPSKRNMALSDIVFPLEKAGRAAAAVTQKSNKLALMYEMSLEVVVHALRGDCTSICAFRKRHASNRHVAHIFPWVGHERGEIVILTTGDGSSWRQSPTTMPGKWHTIPGQNLIAAL